MAKAEENTEEEAPKPKGKRVLLLIVAVVAVVLLVGGGLLVWLLSAKPAVEGQAGHGGEAAVAQEQEEDDSHPPVYVKLDQFTVNLSDGESYLQCEINLKVADADLQDKITQRLPEVRDALLRLLSSQTADELATVEGKDKLAKGVQREVNEVLGIKVAAQGVQKVLFPAFIIQ